MFNLIPASLLIMALGGVVYIFSNHLSDLEEDENNTEDSDFGLKTKLANFVSQMPLDRLKARSLSFTQKSLHRIRILLLKTDNRLMNLIGKISKQNKAVNENGTNSNGNQPQNIDNFWNDFSDTKRKEVPENNIIEMEPEVKIDPSTLFRINGEQNRTIDLAVKSNPVVKIKVSKVGQLKKSSKLKRKK